ncbi:unnamed protein product, partial [Ranitomeya imitator]
YFTETSTLPTIPSTIIGFSTTTITSTETPITPTITKTTTSTTIIPPTTNATTTPTPQTVTPIPTSNSTETPSTPTITETTTSTTTTTYIPPSTSNTTTSIPPVSNTTTITWTPQTGHDIPKSSPATTPAPSKCSPHKHNQVITKNNCSKEVQVMKCQGLCESESWFDDDLDLVNGSCSCCMPVTSSIIEKKVDLYCPQTNSHIPVTIKVFMECVCNYQPCINPKS